MSNTLQKLDVAFSTLKDKTREFKQTLLINDPKGELRSTREGLMVAAGIETALMCFYSITDNPAPGKDLHKSCLNCNNSDCMYYQQYGKACPEWK